MASLLLRDGVGFNRTTVWIDTPTTAGTLLYSVVTPVICTFGIFGNILNILVLTKRELTASVYVYLSVLAVMDLLSCVVLFVSGLSVGVLWYTSNWATFEAMVLLPVAAFLGSMSIFAVVFVTFDRILYLWNPTQTRKPKFCNPSIAKKVMTVSFFAAVLFNVPYCFIYEWEEEKHGKLVNTDFFHSTYYKTHNWICFTIFAVFPAIFLSFGNGFLIWSVTKAFKKGGRIKRTKKKDHINLTITLVAIVIFFFVGDLPMQFVSRRTALTFLYYGDKDRAENSATLETVRQFATVFNAVDVSINFLIYFLFCPPFRRVLDKQFSTKPAKCNHKTLQVNVFLVDNFDVCKNKNFQAEFNVEIDSRNCFEELIANVEACKIQEVQ